MAKLAPLLQPVISFAIRQTVGEAGVVLTTAVLGWFRDNSQLVPKALSRAADRSWQAVGFALGGDGVLARLGVAFARGDDKAYREQVREFLQGVPLPHEMTGDDFRKRCLGEWKKAKTVVLGEGCDSDSLSTEIESWQRFTDPQGLIAGAVESVARVADALAGDYPNLARLLRHPTPAGPPLLAAAFAYFFRREVETNAELARGLTLDAIQHLASDQVARFDRLEATLVGLGEQADQLLGELIEVHTAVLDVRAEVGRLQYMNVEGFAEVRRIGENVQSLIHRLNIATEVRPGTSFSVRTDAERRMVKQLLEEYRKLPDAARDRVPALLNSLGILQVGVGDFAGAKVSFENVAIKVVEPAGQAEAHFNSYRVALERRDFPDALTAIRRAAELATKRFAPFPMKRYVPKSILGAGGFGTVFLCEDKIFKNRQVAVKALHADDLDRSAGELFDEAHVLTELNHPAVIRVLDAAHADPDDELRPYLVMEYFPGDTLGATVDVLGGMPLDAFLPVAAQVAAGMHAAHAKGILHRDLKPENVLVRREGEPGVSTPGFWRAKIIDFGLALRKVAVETRSTSRDQSMQGNSVAGTLRYAPPEQLGRLEGVQTGPHSDVFAFGKMCCYCLFRTTEPKRRHWDAVPGWFAELIERCTEEELTHRLPNFDPILDALVGHVSGLDLPEFGTRVDARRKQEEVEQRKREAEESERKRKEAEEIEAKRKADEERKRQQEEVERNKRIAEEVRTKGIELDPQANAIRCPFCHFTQDIFNLFCEQCKSDLSGVQPIREIASPVKPAATEKITNPKPQTNPSAGQTNSEEERLRREAKRLGLEFVDPSAIAILPNVLDLVPDSVARENVIMPLSFDSGRLRIATADPTNFDLLQKLQFILNKDVTLVFAVRERIEEAINLHYGWSETIDLAAEIKKLEAEQKKKGIAPKKPTLAPDSGISLEVRDKPKPHPKSQPLLRVLDEFELGLDAAFCPSCKTELAVLDRALYGQKADCPKCKFRFTVDEFAIPPLSAPPLEDPDEFELTLNDDVFDLPGEATPSAISKPLVPPKTGRSKPIIPAPLPKSQKAVDAERHLASVAATWQAARSHPDYQPKPVTVPFKQPCPSCENLLSIKDAALIGKKVECAKCRYRFVLQSPDDEFSLDQLDEPNRLIAENPLSFAVPYGLALQGLERSRITTNLLPQDHRPGWLGRRLGRKAEGVAWGIEVGNIGLKAIRLEVDDDGFLIATDAAYIEHEMILTQPYADADLLIEVAVQKFVSEYDTKKTAVVLAIPGQSGLARFVKVPENDPKLLPGRIVREASAQIPFLLDEVVWDHQILSDAKDSSLETEVAIFAVKKDMANRVISPWTKAGVAITVLQLAPIALANYVAFDLLGSESLAGACIAALDIGADSSTLVITDGDRIVWQRPIPLGGNHFTQALMKELKLTFDKAEHMKLNASKDADPKRIFTTLKPVFNDFVGEIQRSLSYFTKTYSEATIGYIHGVGNGFRLPGLQKFLSAKLEIEVRKPDSFLRLGKRLPL